MTDFHHQIGKTIESWSYIESSLCSVFIRVTKTHPPMGRKIFYSAAGFRARTKILRVAIECVKIVEEDVRDFWTGAIDKADKYSVFRNLMVHGDIVFVNFAQSKHFKRYVILQGREFWKADPDPKDVITHEQLSIADHNFRLLASCMMSVLGEPDPKSISAQAKESRELIALLPNQADSSRLAPSDLVRFSQLKSVPFER